LVTAMPPVVDWARSAITPPLDGSVARELRCPAKVSVAVSEIDV